MVNRKYLVFVWMVSAGARRFLMAGFFFFFFRGGEVVKIVLFFGGESFFFCTVWARKRELNQVLNHGSVVWRSFEIHFD